MGLRLFFSKNKILILLVVCFVALILSYSVSTLKTYASTGDNITDLNGTYWSIPTTLSSAPSGISSPTWFRVDAVISKIYTADGSYNNATISRTGGYFYLSNTSVAFPYTSNTASSLVYPNVMNNFNGSQYVNIRTAENTYKHLSQPATIHFTSTQTSPELLNYVKTHFTYLGRDGELNAPVIYFNSNEVRIYWSNVASASDFVVYRNGVQFNVAIQYNSAENYFYFLPNLSGTYNVQAIDYSDELAPSPLSNTIEIDLASISAVGIWQVKSNFNYDFSMLTNTIIRTLDITWKATNWQYAPNYQLDISKGGITFYNAQFGESFPLLTKGHSGVVVNYFSDTNLFYIYNSDDVNDSQLVQFLFTNFNRISDDPNTTPPSYDPPASGDGDEDSFLAIGVWVRRLVQRFRELFGSTNITGFFKDAFSWLPDEFLLVISTALLTALFLRLLNLFK